MTDGCDDVHEEVFESANEYRNCWNDVMERLEPARMLTLNSPNRGEQAGEKTAVGQMVICVQIDEREVVNWRRTRPHENTEPARAGGGKCRENGYAVAYRRACEKNTRSRNLEVPDHAGSKSLAPANRNLAGKKLTRQLRGLGGRVAKDGSQKMRPRMRKIFKTLNVARVNFANRGYIRLIEGIYASNKMLREEQI